VAGFLTGLISICAAGSLLLSAPLQTAAPQNDLGGHLFLVNREWRVSADFVPVVVLSNVPGQVRNMEPEAAAALERLFAAAKEETGVTLVSISGYRSYSTQRAIYNRKLSRVNGSKTRADQYVARPGASEHQLGLAMDVGQKGKTGLGSSFGRTEGGIWLRENCARFGFILRYQEGWESVTGYNYEPWHIRYVGEAAEQITASGLPYETWLLQYRKQVLMDIISADP